MRHPAQWIAGVAALALVPGAAAAAWAPPVRVSPRDAASYAAPDLAVGAGGRALAAWVRTPAGGTRAGGRVQVASRPSAAARWDRPRLLSGRGARAVAVGLNARGDAVVAWTVGRRIQAGVRRGAAGTWSTATVIDLGAASVAEMRVAVARDGRPAVLWAERRGDAYTVRVAARVTASAGWRLRPPHLTTPGPEPPAIALSARAGALVTWVDGRALRAARTVRGAFEKPSEVSGDDAGPPAAALSPAGAALTAWSVDLPGGTSVVQARGRPAGGRWAVADDIGIGGVPSAAIDDDGDAVVAWGLAGPGAPQGVEAAARRRGGPWSASTVVPRASCGCRLRVGTTAIGDDGTALVGWRRQDDDGRIVGGAASLRRGAATWTRARITPGRSTDAPVVAATGRGVGLAVWAERGPGGGVRAASLR